jgi:hypothetical protein
MFSEKKEMFLIIKRDNYMDVKGIFSSSNEAREAVKLFGNSSVEYIIYKLYVNEFISDYFLNLSDQIVERM